MMAAPITRRPKNGAQTGLSSCDLDHSQVAMSRSTDTHLPYLD